MKPYITFILVLAMFLFGCKDYGVSPTEAHMVYPDLSSSDFYDYVDYDSLGSVSATGKLTLSTAHSRITGSWSFDDGRSGRVHGTIDNGTMAINLYPDSVAYHLILTANLPLSFPKGFSGEWKLDSLGVHQRGHFDATYKYSVVVLAKCKELAPLLATTKWSQS